MFALHLNQLFYPSVLKMNSIMSDSISNPNITPTLKMNFVDRLHQDKLLNKTMLQ